MRLDRVRYVGVFAVKQLEGLKDQLFFATRACPPLTVGKKTQASVRFGRGRERLAQPSSRRWRCAGLVAATRTPQHPPGHRRKTYLESKPSYNSQSALRPELSCAPFPQACLKVVTLHKNGGGVWKSNPPFDPRRAESPALKAGKITGPFSPPSLQEHHNKTLISTPITPWRQERPIPKLSRYRVRCRPPLVKFPH
jgi:hypothetical protein